MQYRRLGRTGLKVSAVGLGSWLTFGGSVDLKRSRECIRKALRKGINLLDTADVYSGGRAEEVLGKVLKKLSRTRVVLATKCFFPTGTRPNDQGLSRKHVFESCHASLRRLRTDYIDLYQCHRFDEETPVDETVAAMSDLVRQGKILYWGTSMWTGDQIEEACTIADRIGGTRPVSNQPAYSLLERDIEEEVIPRCEQLGIGQIVYSPLAQGVLTGKYSGGTIGAGTRASREDDGQFMKHHLEPEVLARVDSFVELAREHTLTPAQMALAWCLRQQNVASVLVGVSNLEQLLENAGAADMEIADDVFDDAARRCGGRSDR